MTIPYRDGLPSCNRSGVYSITCKVNGKPYIGSSLCIRGRMRYHRGNLRAGTHENSYLQRAWNKYGEKNFKFAIVELCAPKKTVKREQYWIDTLDTCNRSNGYNICPFTDGGPMRGRRHSPESRAKMSASQKASSKKGQPLATIAAAKANRGRKLSPELIKRRADLQRGRDLGPIWLANMTANHWSRKPNAADVAARSAAGNRGKKLSPEHVAALRKGHRRYWRLKRAGVAHGKSATA